MSHAWNISLVWWITVVEIPAMAGLFWIVWTTARQSREALDGVERHVELALAHLRQNLDAYKLDVAKTYASIAYIKDVERRLTRHLIRIEEKLDQQRAPRMGGEV